MRRLIALTTATAAIAFAGAAFAQEPATIGHVDVVAQQSDFTNDNALKYWPEIESDLRTAMEAAAAQTSSWSGRGYDVDVRLTKVSLAGAAMLPETSGKNQLEGWIYVRTSDRSKDIGSFKMKIDIVPGQPGRQNGVEVYPSDADFYAYMLKRFAEKTVSKALVL